MNKMSELQLYSASGKNVNRFYELGTVSPIIYSHPIVDIYSTIAQSALGSSAPLDYSSEYAKTPRCIQISSLMHRDTEFQLVHNIPAFVTIHDNRYVIENNELGIFAVNRNFEQGVEEFREGLSFLLSEYGEADERDLTNEARELRQRILNYTRR